MKYLLKIIYHIVVTPAACFAALFISVLWLLVGLLCPIFRFLWDFKLALVNPDDLFAFSEESAFGGWWPLLRFYIRNWFRSKFEMKLNVNYIKVGDRLDDWTGNIIQVWETPTYSRKTYKVFIV